MSIRCPKCGEVFEHTCRDDLPDVVYIEIRDKSKGFQGSLAPDQLRYWEPLNRVHTSLSGAVGSCPIVTDGAIFECRKIGTRGDLAKKMKGEEL